MSTVWEGSHAVFSMLRDKYMIADRNDWGDYMKTSFSSAGLLYVYLNGYEENGMLYVQQTDTYRHIEDGFYRKVMENVELADEDENMVHVFAVVGSTEKANIAYSIVEDGIKANYQRILSGQKIKKNASKLDRTGNAFFRCVQEFFCERPDHFPKRIYHEYDGLIIGGICCSRRTDKLCDSVINNMVSLWMEREEPMLCGQQLMIRSFFLSDFVGRKAIAALPETETGSWRLVFEGGQQLFLHDECPYVKETLHPNDLGSFCSSNLQSILLNPFYAYGRWFQPNDICEEWHKAFLYLCAVSEIEWNRSNIVEVYEAFLKFLEVNICITMDGPPLISKERYREVLLTHIAHFRDFLRGYDEPVISKDLHQTLNSRYVYLPYLWPLVHQKTTPTFFSASVLQELIYCAMQEKDTHKKGILWEDVSAYVLSSIAGWKITGRRIRTGAHEIDISIANISLDDQLWQLGAYILVECKNWNTHVDIHQIRNIVHISNLKGNKTAILFAANGITKDAQKEISRLTSENIHILCVTAKDLFLLQSARDCKNLFLNKWICLQNSIEISTIM